MVDSNVSILLAQTSSIVNEVVSELNYQGIEIATGFLRSNSDLIKAYRHHHWDIIILNLDHDEFNYLKAIRVIQRRKAQSRIIATGRLKNRDEVNRLLKTGIHEFIPINDPVLLEIKITQNIEFSLLRKRTRELEHDLNYKSQFIAKISHEMRTTLNSVILLSEILAENRNRSLKDDEIEYIDLIHGSSNNLLDLLNKILDLSKIQSGKMNIQLEQIDVKDFSKRFSRLYIPVAREKSIRFIYDNKLSEEQQIKTDRIRLEQVLNNLISNAIKFTKKGHVKLKTYIPSKNELNFHKLDQNEKMIAFEVSDTGIGISDEKIQIIFESYVQAEGQKTENSYGGTGLGLAISKEIAQILGGKLTLETLYGEGSTFTVYMPFNSQKAVENKPEVEVVKVLKKDKTKEVKPLPKLKKNSKVNILLIDNSTIHNMALKEFLSVVVKDCITAESAQEAYEFLNSDHRFDCIILDMYLPDAYGKDVLQKIREIDHRKTTPVIIYSGKTISKTEQKELYQEAMAVVQKNVNSYKVLLGHLSDIIKE